ncbi:alanine racemase [Alsobacter sp. SYSU M60028]|uniref:Alanine racemase n=1 Tax=Alsobacter ponti TaxID=2962936 RepID=A0ABT1LFX4_9HYPH|nr:alanine racemase [Alsobacter ponti]
MPTAPTTEIDTPAPVLDLAVVERNLARAQAYFARHGIELRPHVKTHKSAALARRQREFGAVGVTCQKLGEAEAMAAGGLDDILITFPIVGDSKLRRLTALAVRARMTVAVDSVEVAAGIADASRRAGQPIRLLVECDTGGERCGVQSPLAAAELAARIAALEGVSFGGLMTYPPKGRIEHTARYLAEAVARLRAAGLEPGVVSVGGTPDMYRAHEFGLTSLGVTQEHRPGTYIFSDRYMAAHGVGGIEDCALRIVATVVSRPTPTRVIIDAGSKVFSSDLMGFEDYGVVLGAPGARLEKLSEEHGHLALSAPSPTPGIGDRLTIIPNHACAVTNLTDRFVTLGPDGRLGSLPVDARGKVT